MPYTKTEKLIMAIRERIESGEFGPGDKLPSGTELIAEYKISRMTVNMAMERLKASGEVEGVPGSGWYVPE